MTAAALAAANAYRSLATATAGGSGAAKGAAIGAIADGGDGAARGAAIGAGASALKKGESAGFEAGAVIPFKLAGPLTVTVKP